MAKWIKRFGVGLVVAAAAFWTSGCESVHNENLKQAEARWARARASVMLQLAEQQYKSNQLDKALTTLGKALDMDPHFPRLQTLRGQILAEKGQGNAAVAAFELAIVLDPQSADAHYHCAVQLERWAQFEKALEHYRSAHSLSPNNVVYGVAVAEVLGQLNRIDEALALLDKMLTTQEQSVALLVTAGELCMARGDFELASRYFREAARLATGDSSILRALGLSLHYAGHHDEARGYLEQLVSQEPRPNIPREPSSRASQPAGAGVEQSVEEDLSEGAAEVLSALGDCYLLARQPDKARACFIELTRLCPNRAGPWENLAKVALEQGRWEEAQSAADRALALSPNSVCAHLVRGYALANRDQPAEAAAALRRAHRLAPGDVLMLCLLADSYRKLGDTRTAREALVRALQIAPTDPLVNRLMDDLARAEFGQPDEPLRPPTVTAGVVVPE